MVFHIYQPLLFQMVFNISTLFSTSLYRKLSSLPFSFLVVITHFSFLHETFPSYSCKKEGLNSQPFPMSRVA